MRVDFSPPDIIEEDIMAVSDVLRSGWITTGPVTKSFERYLSEYIGTEKVLCLNSATSALFLALKILGVGPGDQVVTTPYTYTASASVITHVGATPVFVDLKKGSLEMDYDKLESVINDKTKAVIAVDIAGRMCDYDAIYKVVEACRERFTANSALQEKYGRIAVISDSAHSLGAERKGLKAGQAADITCYSFHAVKNITTAEGGAITWKNHPEINNVEMYDMLNKFSLHGQSKDAFAKTQLSAWEYDIIYPAYKTNMTDVSAALGLSQLKRYDKILEQRYSLVKQYEEGLDGSDVRVMQHTGNDYISSHHLLITWLEGYMEEQRNDVIKALSEKDIATNVHYKPLPMFSAYRNLGYDIKDYPNALETYRNELTLPLNTRLTTEQVDYVVKAMREIIKKC